MPDDRPMTLYCFAHAGAGVGCFHRWPALAGPGTEIVPLLLPGRGRRRREPRITGRDALVDAFVDLFREHGRPDQGPFALYGHSLGGLVAYTLARALADKRLPRPEFVALGATPSPEHAPALAAAADAPVAELQRRLGALGALPGDGAADPGSLWHRTVLPVLRDDLRLAAVLRAAALEPSTGGPLDMPLLVLGGTDDPVAPAEKLGGWRRWSTAGVVLRAVAGDHFFVRGPQAPRILGRACRVARRLSPEAPPTARSTVRKSR